MNRFVPLALGPLVIVAACSFGHGDSIDAVGSVRAVITSVPPAVSCVQLIAAAGRSITSSVDVTTGQDVTIRLDNVPVGNVTFTAFAFTKRCADSAGTQPSWASSPTVSTILPGQVASLQLTLNQVGGANVGINFDTDGGTAIDMSTPPDLAVAPATLSASPASLNFGFIAPPPFNPPPQNVTITNVGTAPSGPVFGQITGATVFNVNGCGAPLPPGGSCTLTVGAMSGGGTNINASLVVSGAPSNTVVVPIHAN